MSSSMQFGSQAGSSNMCGVTLMNTPIGRVVADPNRGGVVQSLNGGRVTPPARH